MGETNQRSVAMASRLTDEVCLRSLVEESTTESVVAIELESRLIMDETCLMRDLDVPADDALKIELRSQAAKRFSAIWLGTSRSALGLQLLDQGLGTFFEAGKGEHLHHTFFTAKAKGEPTQGTLCCRRISNSLSSVLIFHRRRQVLTRWPTIHPQRGLYVSCCLERFCLSDKLTLAQIADETLSQKILDTIQQASHYRQVSIHVMCDTAARLTGRQLKKGANEGEHSKLIDVIRLLTSGSHQNSQSRYRRAHRPRRRYFASCNPSPPPAALRG